MATFAGRLFAGRLFRGRLFARTRAAVVGPDDTNHYRRIARDVAALRVVGDAAPVMMAIGRRRYR